MFPIAYNWPYYNFSDFFFFLIFMVFDYAFRNAL